MARYIVPVNFTVEARSSEQAEQDLKEWLDGFKENSPEQSDAYYRRLDFMVWPAVRTVDEKAGAA